MQKTRTRTRTIYSPRLPTVLVGSFPVSTMFWVKKSGSKISRILAARRRITVCLPAIVFEQAVVAQMVAFGGCPYGLGVSAGDSFRADPSTVAIEVKWRGGGACCR